MADKTARYTDGIPKKFIDNEDGTWSELVATSAEGEGGVSDVNITDRVGRLVGVVSLDAAALAALEATTVTLDAGSLANLESISVQNNVSNDMLDRSGRLVGVVTLDAASLAALESITVVDGGGSLTVDGTVAVSNPTANPETGLAKDATLTGRLPAALDGDGGVKTHVQNFPATQPVSGPLTDTQLRATALPISGNVGIAGNVEVVNDVGNPLPVSGTVSTTLHTSATGTQTSVANAVTNVTLLAANSDRKGATIYNDDTAAILKIKLGATASASSFTCAIAPGGYYEVPFGYTGIIDGIASVATGNARITEMT